MAWVVALCSTRNVYQLLLLEKGFTEFWFDNPHTLFEYLGQVFNLILALIVSKRKRYDVNENIQPPNNDDFYVRRQIYNLS